MWLLPLSTSVILLLLPTQPFAACCFGWSFFFQRLNMTFIIVMVYGLFPGAGCLLFYFIFGPSLSYMQVIIHRCIMHLVICCQITIVWHVQNTIFWKQERLQCRASVIARQNLKDLKYLHTGLWVWLQLYTPIQVCRILSKFILRRHCLSSMSFHTGLSLIWQLMFGTLSLMCTVILVFFPAQSTKYE